MGPFYLQRVKSKNIDTQLCLTLRSSVCAMLPLNFLVWAEVSAGCLGVLMEEWAKNWISSGTDNLCLAKCLLNLRIHWIPVELNSELQLIVSSWMNVSKPRYWEQNQRGNSVKTLEALAHVPTYSIYWAFMWACLKPNPTFLVRVWNRERHCRLTENLPNFLLQLPLGKEFTFIVDRELFWGTYFPRGLMATDWGQRWGREGFSKDFKNRSNFP